MDYLFEGVISKLIGAFVIILLLMVIIILAAEFVLSVKSDLQSMQHNELVNKMLMEGKAPIQPIEIKQTK